MPLTLLSNALDAKYLKRDGNPQRCVPVPSAHELVCKLHLLSLTVPHAVPAQQILGQHSEIALLKNRQFIFITILINQNFQQEYSQFFLAINIVNPLIQRNTMSLWRGTYQLSICWDKVPCNTNGSHRVSDTTGTFGCLHWTRGHFVDYHHFCFGIVPVKKMNVWFYDYCHPHFP